MPRSAEKRRPVVLYQPSDEGTVMPLGLLALGSWLAGEHVVIVDGRFELAPESRIVELARGALCLGVTVRTGPRLREALRVSAAARAASPGLAVVWGGPHPRSTRGPASQRGSWTPAPWAPARSPWPRWRRRCAAGAGSRAWPAW